MNRCITTTLTAILIGFGLASCGGRGDETVELGAHVGKEMALNRPWVIERHDNNKVVNHTIFVECATSACWFVQY